MDEHEGNDIYMCEYVYDETYKVRGGSKSVQRSTERQPVGSALEKVSRLQHFIPAVFLGAHHQPLSPLPRP